MEYTESFSWRDKGSTVTITVTRHTQEEARARIVECMRDSISFRFPRWWQFWRWDEYVPGWLKQGLTDN